MVDNKYDAKITKEDFCNYLTITKNSIYKLLCDYEEDNDWGKGLQTILYELSGSCELFNNKVNFIKIISKLESLKNNMGSGFFRKTIFETLNLIDREIKHELL